MKERPILFSTPMVQAILDGRKTQTRRKINHFGNNMHYGMLLGAWGLSDDPQHIKDNKWQWTLQTDVDDNGIFYLNCPYGQIGDVLWVRETFAMSYDTEDHPELPGNDQETGYVYKADGKPFYQIDKWKPSIFMPREACRIRLEITNIRVERLREISESNAISEGIIHNSMNDPRIEFQWLWQSINGIESWELNPYVWVIEFKKL